MNFGTGHARGETSQGKSKDGCRPSLRPGSDQRAAAESAGFCRGRSRSMWWELQGLNASHVCWSEDGADDRWNREIQTLKEAKVAFFYIQVTKMSNHLCSGLLFGVFGGSRRFRVVNLSSLLSFGADFYGLFLLPLVTRRCESGKICLLLFNFCLKIKCCANR